MRTGLLMVAAVVTAAIVGWVAQGRVDPPRPYAAPEREAGSGSPRPLEAEEPAATGDGESLRGRVLEVIDVAQYTYVRLAAAQGELWAAVSKAPVAVGSEVTVVDANRMERFESATLKRTFDVIYFGSLGGSKGSTSAALPPGHPRIDEEPTPTPGVEVARASGKGAQTIYELFERRAQLAGQVVRVRGQVVKVTPGVLGKTYLRLRDGSGASPETRELVVTSQSDAHVGDVSTYEGTLLTEVDVGIGLVYPVLLSDAKRLAEPAAAADRL